MFVTNGVRKGVIKELLVSEIWAFLVKNGSYTTSEAANDMKNLEKDRKIPKILVDD